VDGRKGNVRREEDGEMIARMFTTADAKARK
jgi:hypothetical protein